MVLSRNEKRKRKEGDLVDLMEPLSETPKRTKVHAQRKFAQGASTVFNPPYTPVKDKERIKPSIMKELITHKRPNTEDFLTFLCYRGTSILPPGLNFFNVGAKKEKDSKSIRTVTDKNISPSNIVNEIQKGDSNQKVLAKVKNIITDTKRVSNEIQKNITKFKTTTSTVQALKKKYQEQRLAKQRIQNKFKSSCVMRTRSCTERNILKAGCTLTSRKFLPRIEAKRHGLRSTAIVHKHKKASPKVKSILPKSKKKVLVKNKSSDMSNSDVTSEDEEIPSEKSVPQLKRLVQKSVQKICTRSKSELRRVTRSHTGKITSKTISRRPTRKTKEAAALYMEILGRKLVSPDLGNDDNASVESFPELPNARKQISPERVVKDKVKQNTIKSISKSKSNKPDSFRTNTNNKRLDKSKSRKIVFKSKRILRVQRYCEIDSDDESASSMQSNNARPSTRQSVNKLDIPVGRSLRSSSRNIITRLEDQNRLNIKTPPLAQNLKTSKTKFVMKRKRDTSINKIPCQKNNKSKLGAMKTHQNENVESDEETLGMLLDKMKKKKDFLEEVTHASTCTDNVTDIQTNSAEIHNIKEDLSKASDDEGSFRGFTQKAISNVLNSCQTHANVGLFETDETTDKLSICEAKNVSLTEKDVTMNKEEKESTPLNTETVHKASTFLQEQDTIINLCESPESTLKVDKKFTLNESETSSAHIIDMSLSALHVRKERVNMSTEQIEKWLSESSLAKEESKLEMENMSSFRYDVGISQKLKPDASHLSISTKIQHLVRPVNVTVSKLADKTGRKERIGIQNKCNSTVLSHLRVNELKPPNIPSDKTVGIKDIAKERLKSVPDTFSEDNEVGSKVDSNSTDGSVDKKLLEKKSIVQPRKPFLPKVKERKVITPNANAFSPENESSVYAFESDTEIPVGTPFRRKVRDTGKPNTTIALSETEVIKSEQEDVKSTSQMSQCSQNILRSNTINEKSDAHDKKNMANTTLNKFELSKNFVNLANVQVLPFDKLTTSWTNVNCSASIAVQVNFDDNTEESEDVKMEDSNKQKSTEISTQTECNNENDDDNDGQLFYIPLQAMTRNGPNLLQGQQLIQGVAVKLGTEGTNGPNQRVLLRAKLVTKPPVSVARCPPIGTVQPTTRTPQNCTTTLTQQSVVSTSTNTTSVAVVSNTEHQSPVLTRNESTVKINPQDNNLSSTTVTPSSPEKVIKSPKPSRDCKVHIDSMKNTKRSYTKSKQKLTESSGVNGSTLSNSKGMNNEARLVEAPTFHPTEKDFQDPLEYIDKIRPVAEKFGICRVVPPPNFKPDCKVSDDMRFTAYNQYVHRMLHRWGPNVKEMMAIKKYLATQSITLTQPPWIGGMEVDLPHLYQTVQSLGGLKEVIEKKKWQKVADGMKIPKSAQDRVTKLDDIYCKYLLPYDTLSQEERAKLFNEVEVEWLKREAKALQRQELLPIENEDDDEDDSSDEIEECIVKGRNMPLDAFYRIARNTQRMWFGENQRSGNEAEGASADEVETAFWRHVAERKRHVCVHAASIDSGGRGFGFSVARYSPFARHPWNLKVFTNNAGSVLRALGPLMGVTVPTLHVGMLFSACCWYRDPHGLPWIEYLHTGGKKIWYGIPNEHNDSFREALSKMVPRYCKNKTIWLPSDTAMVPPELLVSNGVPLCQTVQEPGQFIIVFPKAFTSSICTGYVVSESVYFAQASWLETAEQVFKDIHDSSEPSIFSFERLLFNIINDSRSHIDILKQILPSVIKICEKEIDYRKRLESLGLTDTERIPLPDSGKRRQRRSVKQGDSDYECDTCRANLFVSSVNNGHDDSVYCLSHALQMLTQKRHLSKHCTLMYTYSEEELNELIQKLEDRIEAKSKKSNHIKQSK